MNKTITQLMNETSEILENFKFSDDIDRLSQIQNSINEHAMIEVYSLKKGKTCFVIVFEEENGFVSKKFYIKE